MFNTNKKVKLLLVLFAAAAGIGILSAIGSSCPTFNPPTSGPLSIMGPLQGVFIITTILTYIVTFISGFLIWAYFSKWSYTYIVSLISSILGTLSGFIPAIIVMANGMRFSPSLMRAVVNLIIFIMLIIPTVKSDVKTFLTKGESKMSGKIGTQLSSMSVVLFGFAIVIIIAAILLPSTHMIDGVNYWDFVEIQLITALSSLIGGFSMLIGGFIINQLSSPSYPTKSLE